MNIYCGRRGVKRETIRMTPGSANRDSTQTLNPAHLTPAALKRSPAISISIDMYI